MEVKRIAVIGAGPAGLIASQILSTRRDFEHLVFERNSDVGGMWLYSDKTEIDNEGHRMYSSIYKDLVTNFPTALMTFAGHPWPSDVDPFDFVSHQRVLRYLQDFVSQHDIRRYVRTNSAVKLIKPLNKNEKFPQLLVTIENVLDKATEEVCFDAVLICTGAFVDPYIPELEGLKDFRGKILHSCQYRSPEFCTGKQVVVVGGGRSAFDIGLSISKMAKFLTFCVTDYDSFKLKKQYHDGKLPSHVDVKHLSKITRIGEFHINFADSEPLTADIILFCTGYKYHYPFLHPDCGITVTDFNVSPLYRHTVCTKHPNIMFVGMPYCPVISIACWQVPFALKILDGTLELPSEEDMNADVDAEMAERKTCRWYRGRENHHFLTKEFPPIRFFKDLCKVAKLPPFPDALQKLMTEIKKQQDENVMVFRDVEYCLDGPGMYKHSLKDMSEER